MKEEIRKNIENSDVLEKLYQSDKSTFKNMFFEIYPEISHVVGAKFWKSRLEYSQRDSAKIKLINKDFFSLVISFIVTYVFIKLPTIFSFGEVWQELFYQRNIPIIVFAGLIVYSILNGQKLAKKNLLIILTSLLIITYINLLPINESSSTNLIYIFSPLLFWGLYGMWVINFDFKNLSKRFEYIKYNADLIVLGALIAISGGIFSGITIALFSTLGLEIETFYGEYVIIPGVVSAPILAVFILKIIPNLTRKIVPIIANIFSPLVLVTLVIFSISTIVSTNNPFNDREFLLIFNIVIIGVMALIVFSISGIFKNQKYTFNKRILFLLSSITLIINVVALFAIIYRLDRFGITPNRIVVLGSNILIFINLFQMMIALYKSCFRKKQEFQIETVIAKYLPVYLLWICFVVFVLPVLFRFA